MGLEARLTLHGKPVMSQPWTSAGARVNDRDGCLFVDLPDIIFRGVTLVADGCEIVGSRGRIVAWSFPMEVAPAHGDVTVQACEISLSALDEQPAVTVRRPRKVV